MESIPQIIEGGLHVDPRGTLGFVNAFDFKGVDRVYWVRAHQPNQWRGWMGHRRDHKWFLVLEGTVVVAVVQPDDWEKPARTLAVKKFTLSGAKPQILHVPPGHATASLDLSGGALLQVFSSGTIQEAKTDDYRFPTDYWKVEI